MKCPVCGAAELIHDTRDLPYTYKGETTVIAAVTGDFCRQRNFFSVNFFRRCHRDGSLSLSG